MQSASSFSSSTRPLPSSAEHTDRFAVAVAVLHAAEVGAVGVALARVAAEAERLQVAESVGTDLVFGDDVVRLQGPLVLVGAAALAAAPVAGENPLFHRAADRGAVTAAVRKHLVARAVTDCVLRCSPCQVPAAGTPAPRASRAPWPRWPQPGRRAGVTDCQP